MKGFTLVEMLIAIVVLGILAAVVVPQFGNASNEAMAGNLTSQLRSLQNQIELYAARNSGRYPITSMEPNWDLLRNGGYIKADPVNPAQRTPNVGKSSMAFVQTPGVRGSASAAWVWNQPTLVATPLIVVLFGPPPSPTTLPWGPPSLHASYFDETTGQVTSVATD